VERLVREIQRLIAVRKRRSERRSRRDQDKNVASRVPDCNDSVFRNDLSGSLKFAKSRNVSRIKPKEKRRKRKQETPIEELERAESHPTEWSIKW